MFILQIKQLDVSSLNNSFDRDTAGAVAGAILGTYWGESGIPDRWKEQVEKADLIRDLADTLIERSN